MAVTRPLKEGSVTTYQAKVAAGFPDILASEMDADLDTIYAAWNGGLGANTIGASQIIDGSVGTLELADGAVTTAKHADAPNGVTAAKINDGTITLAKLGGGASINAVGAFDDFTTPITVTSALTFIGEKSLVVVAGRPILVFVRVWLDTTRLAAGTNASGASIRTYVGGTSSTLDGTLATNEACGDVALSAINETDTYWYTHFRVELTVATSPYLLKVFAINDNSSVASVRKRGVGINLVQLA